MYYIPNNQGVTKTKSKIYIAKYLETTQDEYLNQVKVYDKPKKYFMNVQPVSIQGQNSSQVEAYGQIINSMKVAVVPKNKYLGKFKEFDLVYLEGASPDGEFSNGDNANYRIYSVRNQNSIISIYFEKLIDNQ